MAAGHRAGQSQHVRSDDRTRLRARYGRRPDLADQHAGQADGADQAGYLWRGRRQRPAGGDRPGRPVLPAPRAEPVAGRHGGADLAERQSRWRRPRRVVRGVRQPHARVGCAGDRAAELGDGRDDLSLAGARVGRFACRSQSRLTGRHLGPAGRPSPSSLASAGRRLHASAGRLGAVRRSCRGGHQVRRRGPVHDRRRLRAEPFGQRPRVRRSAGGSGRGRLRQQRHAAQRGQPELPAARRGAP